MELQDYLYIYVFILVCFGILWNLGLNDVYAYSYPDIQTPNPPDFWVETANPSWWEGLLALGYNFTQNVAFVINNLVYFTSLMTVDLGIGLMGTLLFTPLIGILLYMILRLVRGGG